jgi:hypothetical protein
MARRHTAKGLASLSREERRGLHVGRRRYKLKPREDRRKLSRLGLLDYLRRHDFQTWRQLDAGRKPGDPTIGDYRREFGSWLKAKTEAFGQEAFKAEITGDYLTQVAADNNLWTYRAYLRARQLKPEIVPSMYYVIKEFKYWANFKYCAERYSGRRILEKYLRLKRRLGRLPKAEECYKHDIDVERLVILFGGRKSFTQIVLSMEQEYEKRKGAKPKAR